MPARVIIFVFAIIRFSVCEVLHMARFDDMLDAVNKRLPEEERISGSGWYWLKYRLVAAEYDRLYPNGRLARTSRALVMGMWACVVVAVCVFGSWWL